MHLFLVFDDSANKSPVNVRRLFAQVRTKLSPNTGVFAALPMRGNSGVPNCEI